MTDAPPKSAPDGLKIEPSPRYKGAIAERISPTSSSSHGPVCRLLDRFEVRTKMAIKKSEDTICFGSERVPLYRATWKRAPDQPYRRTYDMQPGDRWFEMPTSKEQKEIYALDESCSTVPIGAMVARHLKREGGETVFVELWKGTVVLVDENLICVAPAESAAGPILQRYKERSGKRGAGGFPDVVAVFPDSRIAFREIKKKKKDRVSRDQHKAADILRGMYGSRADLAIVEWEPPEEAG